MVALGKARPFNNDTAEMAPAKPGVYVLMFKDVVVYIGSSSTSIRSRLVSHRKRKTFAKVTHFKYHLVEWASDAIKLEHELCEAFKKKNGGNRPRLQSRTPTKRKSIFDL